MAYLSPSILSADFANLSPQIKALEENDVKYVHVDVMDGHFVPNITIGPLVVDAVNKITDLILDVHLMIENPENYIDEFINAGADIITVHYEATPHIHRLIQSIRDRGVKVGVSINPGTPAHLLDDILHEIDMVLIMSVNPGFGGQKFIEKSIDKIAYLREKSNKEKLGLDIEVDGGIKAHNVKKVIDAGANIIVAGSAIFNDASIADNVKSFRKVING